MEINMEDYMNVVTLKEGLLIFPKGQKTPLYKVKLKTVELLSIKNQNREVWVPKKEYAEFGWILPPDPTTHDLFYVNEGIVLRGEATFSLANKLPFPLTRQLAVFECQYGDIIIKANIMIYEYQCCYTASGDQCKIKFTNIDNKVETKRESRRIGETLGGDKEGVKERGL